MHHQLANPKKILVAPLNWGLGHATRCIPIIHALREQGFHPILASDGVALQLLQKEFPELTCIELPSYNIVYPEKGSHFKWQLVKSLPKIAYAVWAERKKVKKIVQEHAIDGIISDNRLGVHVSKIPSVFITHQLNVLTGNTTRFTSYVHRKIIAKFNACWVPDVATFPNLSGYLGHPEKPLPNVKYIGPLSRLHTKNLPIKYDLMVLLSGPEPQRTLLEEKLMETLETYSGRILFVKGKIEAKQVKEEKNQFTIYNFMSSEALEIAINESDTILCRSGYTTIMDLAKLGKKAFFIPTPGQYEQEYLAKKFKREGIVPSSKQHKFRLSKLEEVTVYRGFKGFPNQVDWNDLFELFY